jgi:hypothetical protein
MPRTFAYLDPRLRGDDRRLRTVVIPAKAGIQNMVL